MRVNVRISAQVGKLHAGAPRPFPVVFRLVVSSAHVGVEFTRPRNDLALEFGEGGAKQDTVDVRRTREPRRLRAIRFCTSRPHRLRR